MQVDFMIWKNSPRIKRGLSRMKGGILFEDSKLWLDVQVLGCVVLSVWNRTLSFSCIRVHPRRSAANF